MTKEKEPGQRRVYVLPAELVERITAFQREKNLPSEVEAVRRLLDEALKFRDTPRTVLERFKERLTTDGIPSSVARDVLVGHPHVTSIGFEERDAVTFTFRNEGTFKIDDKGEAFILDEQRGGYGDPWWDPYLLISPKELPNSSELDDEIPF